MIVSSSGFGALPESVRNYILENNPVNPGETEGLINNNDGLLYGVSNFTSRWAEAVTISFEMDKYRDHPDFAAVSALERGIADGLTQGLMKARTYYPWGGWGLAMRNQPQQIGLKAAYEQIDRLLTRYVSEVPTGINNARALVQNRMDREAEARSALLIQQKKEADAAAIAAELLRSTTAADAAIAQTQEIYEQVNLQTAIAKSKAFKLFGLPLVVAIPAGLALAIGFLMVIKKSRGSALAGYRRRRKRRVRR